MILLLKCLLLDTCGFMTKTPAIYQFSIALLITHWILL